MQKTSEPRPVQFSFRRTVQGQGDCGIQLNRSIFGLATNPDRVFMLGFRKVRILRNFQGRLRQSRRRRKRREIQENRVVRRFRFRRVHCRYVFMSLRGRQSENANFPSGNLPNQFRRSLRRDEGRKRNCRTL